jgi:hypothetical protein
MPMLSDHSANDAEHGHVLAAIFGNARSNGRKVRADALHHLTIKNLLDGLLINIHHKLDTADICRLVGQRRKVAAVHVLE